MKSFEQNLFIKPIRRWVEENKLIAPGDRILVGLSGGKDSTLLLYALSRLKQFGIFDFDLMGITVDHGMLADFEAMKIFLIKHGIPWTVHHEPYLERLEQSEADGFSACYTCARLRKGILKRYAKANGYNKIAFGHTKDDYVETLIMNIMQSGRLASIPASTVDSDSGITLIRPLLSLEETDIIKANQILDTPIVASRCPFGEGKARAKAERKIDKINEILPEFSVQLFKAAHNISPDRL